jgi:hypothetical protein
MGTFGELEKFAAAWQPQVADISEQLSTMGASAEAIKDAPGLGSRDLRT